MNILVNSKATLTLQIHQSEKAFAVHLSDVFHSICFINIFLFLFILLHAYTVHRSSFPQFLPPSVSQSCFTGYCSRLRRVTTIRRLFQCPRNNFIIITELLCFLSYTDSICESAYLCVVHY